MKISTDEVTLRPLRQIDIDHVRACGRAWPQPPGAPPFGPSAARYETDRWVEIHESGAGHAWVVEAPDGSPVGIVLCRITARKMHDLFVAVHPDRRGEGWYRAIDSILWSYYMGQDIVDGGEWSILPDASAVKGYQAAQGWSAKGKRTGRTGLEVDDVEVDRSTWTAAKARTARLEKAVTIT